MRKTRGKILFTSLLASFILFFLFNLSVYSYNDYRICFYEAGKYYNVSPELLMAIALVESNLNPKALNKNKDGSYDIGIMQINTSWIPYLKRQGINESYIWDPCWNIYFGAMVLKHCMNLFGNTWKAVDCYNKGQKKARHSSSYVWKVYKKIEKVKSQLAANTNKGYVKLYDWLNMWFIEQIQSF